jgi:hypothetical protein
MHVKTGLKDALLARIHISLIPYRVPRYAEVASPDGVTNACFEGAIGDFSAGGERKKYRNNCQKKQNFTFA